MNVITDSHDLSKLAGSWRAEGKTIGLVPTMGWFHQGHLSLMQTMRSKADKVVVSLFINPIQFGRGEDLSTYPHDLERDRLLAEETGVDVLFAPQVEDIYPAGFQTSITVKELTRGLCGASRPGHFDGVATVVAKLFNIVRPHLAIFGQKDYQQLAVVRRMAGDLNFDVEIIGHPIVREADGLAMSSRNSYLNPEERKNAGCLFRSVRYAQERVRKAGSQLKVSQLTDEVKEMIEQTPGCEVDYVEVIDTDSLFAVEVIDSRSRIALAVKINRKVRLIDNALLVTPNPNGTET